MSERINKYDEEVKEPLVSTGKHRRDIVSTALYESELEVILSEVENYIRNTYGEHYAGSNDVQVIDSWEASGTLGTTSRDTCEKYIKRFGKKAGNNKKDLLKAFHFLVLMYYDADTKGFTE